MAVLKRGEMGMVAASAIAAATWCAAAAGGGAGVGPLDVPLVVLAPLLVAGVALTAHRRSTQVLPPGRDVVVLTAVTAAGLLGLYLAGWTSREHVVDVARLLPLAVVALTVLWPQPSVLRYSLLLAAGTLLGTVGEPGVSRVAVGGALLSLAVALVTTSRLTAASGPRLGDAGPARGRRVVGEAAAVLVVVGLLAALASSLLPPPPSDGGGLGSDGPASLPRPAAPALEPGDRLDVTAGRGAPGDDVVLLVRTREPDMWRATTYDHWDGEAWSRSSDAREPLGDTVELGVGDIDTDDVRARAFRSVVVLARSAGVLPVAVFPNFLTPVDAPVLQGDDASLYPATPLSRGDRYGVVSDWMHAPGSVLRDAPAGPVPPDVADAYLQLPQVPPRVRALAAEITAGETTTYGRVRAIEDWIDDHTEVTDDAQPVRPGTDPLEAFLFDQRSGPPERAATVMSVMLRTLGIPARIAVGFLPGTPTGPDRQLLVRSRDAHAWVEVWFPTEGWERFDPSGLAPDAHTSESVWDRFLRFLGRLWPLALLLVLVAGGWLAWRIARWSRRRAALPWSTRFFTRVERAGAARGRPRRPQETPVEYAGELSESVLPDPRLVEVGDLVTVAAWSRHEPPAEDRARAERVLREAVRATPVRRLRRLRGRASGSRPAQGPRIAKP